MLLGAGAFTATVGVDAWDVLMPRLMPGLPAGQAIWDAAKHTPGLNQLTGKADHTVIEDIPSVTVPAYPRRVFREMKETMRYGLGEHPEFTQSGEPRGAHKGWEGLLALLGPETTGGGILGKLGATGTATTRDKRQQAREYMVEARRTEGIKSRRNRSDLREAIESGDIQSAIEIRRRMTREQVRDFYRRNRKTPYQLALERVPKAKRADFERLFKDELE
jgi:Spy/CpxP family protein refolding chaperone